MARYLVELLSDGGNRTLNAERSGVANDSPDDDGATGSVACHEQRVWRDDGSGLEGSVDLDASELAFTRGCETLYCLVDASRGRPTRYR